MPIPDLLTAQPAGDRSVTTIGYVLADRTGAVLVDAIIFDPAGKPQPLGSASPPIWLGDHAPAQIQGLLRTAGGLGYASVVARAHLIGPGSFGPRGQYRYQLADATLQPIAAQETTIGDLLSQPAEYESRFIRVVGGLLIRDTSALLVDKLGAGGIPEPKSLQVKLRGPIDDRALLGRLKGVPGGAVHFGRIQIEGLWRTGALTPISITIIT